MGLFGKLFNGLIRSVATNTSFNSAYRASAGLPGRGGYGAERFKSVIEADSSIEEIVEEFEINDETSVYPSPDGYANCWEQAYEEELEKAELVAAMIDVDPEDLIDWEMVERKAYQYAQELAEAWVSGEEWIPIEVMEWAFYEVSDHNG